MHAELKIKSGKGPAEVGCLGPAVVGQAHVDGRVTVHPLLVVQHGLRVPRQHEETHQMTNCSSRSWPRANRSAENAERLSVGRILTIRSARCSPTAGHCWNPCPEKPVA